MKSKSEIKQRLMHSAVKLWGLKHGDQLDPVVKLMIEVFCELAYENENGIEDIRERLLDQLAGSLTPDSLVAAKPAHAVMQIMPAEPESEIDRKTVFYTNRLTPQASNYGLKTINFAPVADHIKLVKGEIKHLLCERNLYRMDVGGEKELWTKANTFCPDLNRTVWIGLELDERIKSLKDIHFYIDFPNTSSRYELYTLLSHTVWKTGGIPLIMETGLPTTEEYTSGGLFARYNLLRTNDEEVMELYRKQFLHVRNSVRTATLKKTPFPSELIPFFPERVNELEPQYWVQIDFPPYFSREDLEDISIHLNTFPVSNKNLKTNTLYENRSMTNILPLPADPGEYFPAVDRFTDLLRTELVTFTSLKIDNINHSIKETEQIIRVMKEKMNNNNFLVKEKPTYLLIDPENEKPGDIYAEYWTTGCESANGLPYGTLLDPLKSIPIVKDSCIC